MQESIKEIRKELIKKSLEYKDVDLKRFALQLDEIMEYVNETEKRTTLLEDLVFESLPYLPTCGGTEEDILLYAEDRGYRVERVSDASGAQSYQILRDKNTSAA